METRKNTKAGVVFWTPAPVRTSPTSSVISEDVWKDEEEEPAENDDDFVSQMDDNGIIGLSEALEDVELGESCSDSDAECNPNFHPGPLTPEDADPSRHERDTPDELSYNLSEHLSHTESPGEDAQMLSPFEDLTGSLKARTVDEEVRQRKDEQGTECVPEWDKYLEGEEAGKRIDPKRKKNNNIGTSRELGTTNDLAESYIAKGDIEKISSTLSCGARLLAVEPATVSNHHCQISQPASPATALTFPLLRHFTAEELAAAPGIDAETFPEISLTESHPESHRSQTSLKSSPHPDVKLRASLQPVAMFSEEVMSNPDSGVSYEPIKASDKSNKSHKQPTPLPRKIRQLSPEETHSRTRSLSTAKAESLKFKQKNPNPDREPKTPIARNNAAEVNESRKEPLSYRIPDFSQVEPRVRFPKGGYKPPKSKHSFKRESQSPEPPFLFKSPADIVKEVLLNTTDRSPASSDSYKPPTSAPNSTVPQEFRGHQQATTLLDQLQEDYNRLLTKYAEAENTIDRLRLEAKDRSIENPQPRPRHCQHITGRAVNLYSDPPKPGYLQSGPNQNTLKFMMLDFPQAQRAENNSASLHPNGHSTHQRSPLVCPSTRSPDQQVGQQLANILYNQADKFLHQLQTFEGLLKGKKLKPFEQMKGLSQLAEGLDSLERGYLLARDEHKLLLQRGAEIGHFDPERELEGLIFQCGLRMEDLKEQVEQMQQEQPTCEAPPSPPPYPTPSSVPSEGGEILTYPQSPPVPLLVDPGKAAAGEVSSASEEEETLNSLYLKPLNNKHRHAEQDFATLMDHYQSFKELPKLLDHNQRSALRSDLQAGDEEKERQGHRTGNLEVQKGVPQRASSQSTTLPVHPHRGRRTLEVGKSHSSSLSSLGEITSLEKRNCSRVLSQDGIISPETDSGFVCSESSRLTPAAAAHLHQRASESVSVSQEGNPGKPQIGPVSAPSPASAPSRSRMSTEPRRASQLSHDMLRRTRQGQRRRTFSCSPQRRVGQTEQTRADSGTSEFGLESDSSHTASADRQNDQYTESVNSLYNSSPSSSPVARNHHGDSLKALSSSQSANRNDAFQTLQGEVRRLRERLESCLRNKKPLSSARAAPLAHEYYTHHSTSTPRIRSGEQWSDVRRTVDEVEESTMRQTIRKRPLSAHRRKSQPDILTGSEPSTPQHLVSKCTQTSAAASDNHCSHTNAVQGRTNPRQHTGVSETADEFDSRARPAPLCPQCLSHHRGRSEMPVGGDGEPTHSSCYHNCSLFGRPEPYRSNTPDCHRVSDSPTHTSRQPVDRAARSRYFAAAAPPTLLQYMPVCQPPLLLYSSPLYVSPSNSTGTSGVRGHREVRGRTRRSLSVDKRRSVDTSLNRAIRAARHMKRTSGHMARSLATGAHYQQLLT
ncbi:microtubule organization protein AKNA isoform X3 [Perca fluviatilis]|uniref:microtubule organization protein AKNA isoform X3 n=1 Tax=Perca fluviatilis TaxID=8168 RepID=UPI001965E27E|nr:microtubule organization protein AKNA isoform X3 [Perca fluviatilis]